MDDKQDLTAPSRLSLSESELCPEVLLEGQEQAYRRDIERLKARKSEFVKVNCPACSASDCSAAFEKYSFTFRSCNQCQTVYMSPRPSPEVMLDYYQNSENYRYWAEHIFPASEQARQEKIHKPWLKKVMHYCKLYGISQEVLLEVGPGFGTFASLATQSEEFTRVIGVEPTPEMAEACRKRGVEVIEKRIEDITVEVPEASVVVAFEVIEHLYDPANFLRAAYQRLGKSGLLVISCPNGLGFDIDLLGSVSLAVDSEHVNLFNPASLTQLVESCGFELREVSTPGRLDAEFVRNAVLAGDFSLEHHKFLQRVLIDGWDELGQRFQQFLADTELSSHMWLVAQKP